MNLPTKEDCDRIVEANDSFVKKEDIINGHNVVQYNYMLASYTDFTDPIGDGSLEAFELRGITFVETDNGWDRTLMLHKFFNLNQSPGYMYDDVCNKKIVGIEEKVDGSLIGFCKIGDKVYAKSKFSFQSDQALAAQEIYENGADIKDFVDYCMKNNYSPLFEYIAPSNRIVVLYPKPKLVLLQVRDNNTGEYLPVDEVYPWYNVPIRMRIYIRPLDTIISEMETLEGIEGHIVRLEDGQMMKVKTKWYLALHGLVSSDGNCSRTDFLINAVIEEVIDDLLSQIPEEFDEVRNRIIEVDNNVVHYINHVVRTVLDVMEKDGMMVRKDFAIKHKSNPFFSIMMRLYGNDFDVDTVRKYVNEYVLKNCKGMDKAEKFYNEEIVD